LSKQNYPKDKYEIIVVDDGNDKTKEMIEKLSISNLKYFKIKNLGYRCVSRARNFGIKKSKNEIIIFVDSDIIVTPNFVLEHIKNHNKDKNLVVIGYTSALETKDKHDKKEIMDLAEKDYNKISTIAIIPNYIDRMSTECLNNLNALEKPWEVFLTGNASIRRQHLIGFGMFDENFRGWGLEDIELGYRLIKRGLKFKLNRNALGYHIGTDIILNPFLNPSQKKWKSYIKNMSYFLKKFNNSEVKKTLIELDKRIPNKFRLFNNEENIEKMIESNNRKIAILFDKQILLLKNSNMLKKWDEIENKLIELGKKRKIDWKIIQEKIENLENKKKKIDWKIIQEKIENLENKKKKIEKEIKLIKLKGIFNDCERKEKEIKNLEKIRNMRWKNIESLENKRYEIEKKKKKMLKKNRIFSDWKRVQEDKKENEKLMNNKFKRIREPEIIKLGEVFERKYIIEKKKLKEPIGPLKLEIKKYEEELLSMWDKEFADINREITHLMGRESLLLKSKGLDKTLKILDEEKRRIASKIDKYRIRYIDPIENKINKLKSERNFLMKKHGILRKFREVERKRKDMENIDENINLLNKSIVALNERTNKLESERNFLMKKHGILRKFREVERKRKDMENKNQLLKIKLKKLELNRQMNSR
jgi:GT2 family glycosyltransferase